VLATDYRNIFTAFQLRFFSMYLYARKILNFLSFKAHTDRERDSITRREFSVLKTNKTFNG
jgi:hypothetical protein